MGIGDEEPSGMEFVDWDELYNRTGNDDDAIIDDIAFRGRWTAIASPAKAGKSTVVLSFAVDATKKGHRVIYVDAEMGRTDVLDRVQDWMRLKPADLADLYYCDLPPKLDNVQGATIFWHAVEAVNPDLVIIDGLNGVVNGAENDDTTWRDMYEWAISPLKKANIAVITTDNTGHGVTARPRGSSVKLDKADAILKLTRTEHGVKLEATHRRTASYPLEQEYTITDPSEAGPAMQVVRLNGKDTPEGTKRIVTLLDQLGAPYDISRRKARDLLNEHGHEAGSNGDLGKILAWRKQQANALVIHSMAGVVPESGDHSRTTRTTPPKVVLDSQDHSLIIPASGAVPTGGLFLGPPPSEGTEQTRTTLVPEQYDGDF